MKKIKTKTEPLLFQCEPNSKMTLFKIASSVWEKKLHANNIIITIGYVVDVRLLAAECSTITINSSHFIFNIL